MGEKGGKVGFFYVLERSQKGRIFYWGWEVVERDGNEKKKGCKVAHPFGTLKEKKGGYGFRAVIGRM